MKLKDITGIFVFCLGVLLTSCNHDVKFDSRKWKENGGDNITLDTRANMVNDLIKSKILINKTIFEIEELIGCSVNIANENNSLYRYYIIQEKYGWDIDPKEITLLKVHYDEKGISDSVELYKTK